MALNTDKPLSPDLSPNTAGASAPAGCRKDDPKGEYTYEYPRPALTADNVIFGFDGDSLQILLVERGIEPFKGSWALPGGFMRMCETIDQCARRELMEETNVRDVYLEQFHVFSTPDRDPRGRVVTVAFIALVRPSDHAVIGGDDASNAMWFDVDMLPPLAFDHRDIIDMARTYLKEMLRIKPLAFKLLNEVFTVDELRRVYEVITGNTYDRRNFHRKLMQTHVIKDVEEDAIDTTDDARNILPEIICCNSSMPMQSESRSCMNSAEEDSDIASGLVLSKGQRIQLSDQPSVKKRGRKLRFFRFNKDRKTDSDPTEDASMKDLFNF